jgi:DNA excision repair protein ERCC-6
MGLGKTTQMCALLSSLISNRKAKSVLIIVPATMLQHWLNELSIWAPGLRRILLHASGEVDGLSRTVSAPLLRTLSRWLREARADRLYEAIDKKDEESMPPHSFCGTGYAILTTYEHVRRNPDTFASHSWSYVVLDEAQKIRNPEADVTLAIKQLRTPHRICLTGTPIQNDYSELWSIFDFCFPSRLGTLPAFQQELADPIKRGGYLNATPMQVQMAYRCALAVRDLISPYLLRRTKKEVKEVALMPQKTEHILFCRLTETQRSLYESYLRSDEVAKVMRGSSNLLGAITMLRKICNHPDLVCDASSVDRLIGNGFNFAETQYLYETDSEEDVEYAGNLSTIQRSGKLEILSKLLPIWKKQGHRVLIFCQWKKMLNIIERYVNLQGWKFGRLDGNTNVAARQKLVDRFNSDESYFGLLCTTRTGGVGLNLTGANRIIIYDPDWNPQTDAQARERAWRFGQEKEVTVYRLITAGTVEEKIYHRQIFKTALSNRVLQDPRQRRLFSQSDLRDLFSLKADTGSLRSGGDGSTDTARYTQGIGVVDPSVDLGRNEKEEEEEDFNIKDDNEETLKSVMQSKGLAGVFDHNFVERDASRKTTTVREMEAKAKEVARAALAALRQSVADEQANPEPQRFGGGIPLAASGGGSSVSLLASIRQNQAAASDKNENAPADDEAKKYAKMLKNLQVFVGRRRPTTDQILSEFKGSALSKEPAVFRRLLQSVATLRNGRWVLKSM